MKIVWPRIVLCLALGAAGSGCTGGAGQKGMAAVWPCMS